MKRNEKAMSDAPYRMRTRLTGRAASLLRIFVTEARRNLGLLLFPLVAALVVYTASETLPSGVWLWSATSSSLQGILILVGPLAAGVAAWVAGRDKRRGTEELIALSPRPMFQRDLILWAATTAWLCLAYTLAAAVLLFLTYRGATWGSPVWWPVSLGLCGILLDSSLGYAAGVYVRSRFTAPLVAVALYWIQGVTIYDLNSSAKYLSPLAGQEFTDVFFEDPYTINAPQSLWLLGLAALILTLVALKRSGSRRAWGAMLAAVVVTAVGVTLLLRTPADYRVLQARAKPVPYEPVCVEKRVRVCVHPAYESLLPGAARISSEVAVPLVGIPGGPVRVEQAPVESKLRPDGTLSFTLYDATTLGGYLAEDVAINLVRDQRATAQYSRREKQSSAPRNGDPCAGFDGYATQSQNVVASWLMKRAGFSYKSSSFGATLDYCPELKAAFERFSSLRPQDREAWLRANYADLRSGKLELKDLP